MNWKFIPGYEEKYKIYENGDVFMNDKKIEPFIHKKFKAPYVLIHNNKGYTVSLAVARLVYETFIKKLNGEMRFKYKDGDKTNCQLFNLEITNRRPKINDGKPIDLDNTKVWKPVRGYEEDYKISESGDVYSVKTNKIMSLQMNTEYYSLELQKNKSKKRKQIHNLVYTTFKNKDVEKGKIVDHKDKNKTNNHISNLREFTRRENAKNIDPYTKKKKYYNIT